MNRAVSILLISIVLFPCALRTVSAQSSQWVHYGQSGRLIYQMDQRGDRLLDYSTAGYEMGAAVPQTSELVDASRIVNLSPLTGDNRAHIQAAINQVAAMPVNAHGYRGIVQLAAGQYDISNTLQIGSSGVILRGVGDGSSPTLNTILRSTATSRITMVDVGNFDEYANELFRSGSPVNILDEVVPAGVTSFRVANTAGYNVGDWINVKRTPTQAWFDLVASHFPDDPSGENFEWNTSDDRFTFQHERQITRIEGNRVFIHAPLSHSIDPLSNGTIEKYTDRRVSYVGIEGIRGDSIFNANETGVYDGRVQFDDENHASTFIKFSHAENSWARDVTGEHLVDTAVLASGSSRSITVDNARYENPVSIVTGGRRYAFNVNGGQFILMQNLEADSARRAFVNNSTFNGFNRGPNVFLNGAATNSFVRSGPHAKYSTGALYDNLSDDGGFEARRAQVSSVHGWRGAHTVIWNSHSPVFQIASPPGSNNYLIGATGGGTSPDPNEAAIDSFGNRIDFGDPANPTNSLYIAQQLEKARFPFEQTREYWVGDFDQLQPGDAADQVYVDPTWLTAIDSLSSPFHSSQPIAAFDDDTFGRRVPFTLEYELAPNEAVTSAVLTIGMKKRGGSSSDDDLLWLDSTSNPLAFASADWGPEFEGNLQVLTLELLGDLSFLEDGQLNGVLSNNRPIDWVHLSLNVIDESLLPPDADFTGDGIVDGTDLLTWQLGFASGASQGAGDADRDGDVDTADLSHWQTQYGNSSTTVLANQAVPEPETLTLVGLASFLLSRRTRGKLGTRCTHPRRSTKH